MKIFVSLAPLVGAAVFGFWHTAIPFEQHAQLTANRQKPNGGNDLYSRGGTSTNSTRWDTLDVREFGAGPGEGDDTIGIQSALNFGFSKGLRYVYCPHGSYTITKTITIPPAVILRGAGMGSGWPDLTYGPITVFSVYGSNTTGFSLYPCY